MASIIAGIDYGEASVSLLKAVSALRKRLRATLYLYHAYQIPRGMPFLSAHVIEALEAEAHAESQNRLRSFLSAHLPSGEKRGIRLMVQREFVSEGLHQHLTTDRYDLLGIGAFGAESEEGSIGFHARHFIRNASIPILIAYPGSFIPWKHMLLVYDAKFQPARLPKVRRFLRRLQVSFSGLPVTHLKDLQKYHQKLQKLVGSAPYEPFSWQGAGLVQVILGAARFVEADTIGILMDPEFIIQGLQATPVEVLHQSPGWIFFPRTGQKLSAETEEAADL